MSIINSVNTANPINSIKTTENRQQDAALFSLANQVKNEINTATAYHSEVNTMPQPHNRPGRDWPKGPWPIVKEGKAGLCHAENELIFDIFGSFTKTTIVNATEINRWISKGNDGGDGWGGGRDVWAVNVSYELELENGSIIQCRYEWMFYTKSYARSFYRDFSIQPQDEMEIVCHEVVTLLYDDTDWTKHNFLEILLYRDGQRVQDSLRTSSEGSNPTNYWKGIKK